MWQAKTASLWLLLQPEVANTLGPTELEKLLPNQKLQKGLQIYKIFCLDKILCSSNSDARRLISQGAAKLNGKKVMDFNYLVTEKDILDNKAIQISIGKKKHALINII